MEVLKSRYGSDRTIEKINHNTMRVMGESLFYKTNSSNKGNTTVFDFEGGPYLTVGGKITYGGIQWKITSIDETATMYADLVGCNITVEPIY